MILAYHAHGSRIHGRGLFAGKSGRAGERVYTPEFGSTEQRGFNHSCDPNMRWVGPLTEPGGSRSQWVLIRAVAQGEELTQDVRLFGSTPIFMRALGCLCPVCAP